MPDITVHFDQKQDPIKPVHGVNNGPVCYGSLVDVSDHYKKAEIPLVRLHDPNWPHPREVDVHIVFPDFDKDPEDPANYDFSRTDEYIRSIMETGAQIVYRLGESIEHTAKKYYVHPPQDYEKWARICLGIIRHYNHGWANGFHYDIAYWEIWNEPDYSLNMWSGTSEQYFQLYETAATAIKRFDPNLKVGGPAVAGAKSDFVTNFLAYCRERNLPIDFFSWHTYTANPLAIAENARHVRAELDRHGYRQTESHLNEWNYFVANFAEIWRKGNEHMRRDTFERQKGVEGASFVAAILTLLQDLPVQVANYYDGQPTALFCGLFDYYGVPRKTYYAFRAFQQLTSHPSRIRTDVEKAAAGLYCCGGKNEAGNAVVMISNFNGESRSYTLDMHGVLDGANLRMEHYQLDDEHNLELIDEGTSGAMSVELFIPKHAVVLLKIMPC